MTPGKDLPQLRAHIARQSSSSVSAYDSDFARQTIRGLDRADGTEDHVVHRPAADNYVAHKALDQYLKTHSPVVDNQPTRINPNRLVSMGGLNMQLMTGPSYNIYDAIGDWLQKQPDHFTLTQAKLDEAHIQQYFKPSSKSEPSLESLMGMASPSIGIAHSEARSIKGSAPKLDVVECGFGLGWTQTYIPLPYPTIKCPVVGK